LTQPPTSDGLEALGTGGPLSQRMTAVQPPTPEPLALVSCPRNTLLLSSLGAPKVDYPVPLLLSIPSRKSH
jgi:hypothetical protein